MAYRPLACKSGEIALKPEMKKNLFYLNIAAFLCHSVLAGVTIGLGNRDLAVPVYAARLSVKFYNNGSAFKLEPSETYVVGRLYLTYAMASFFLLSAAAHLCNFSCLEEYYISWLRRGHAPMRWVEYSFSASVMMLIIAYLCTLVHLNELLCVFGLTFTTMIFGHLQEVMCCPKGEEWDPPLFPGKLQAHLFGWVPQLLAWGLIWSQFLRANKQGTLPNGEVRKMPDFVYAIVISETILFCSFAVVQIVVYSSNPSSYIKGEIAYLVLSLASKTVLGGLLLSNVIRLGEYSEIFD